MVLERHSCRWEVSVAELGTTLLRYSLGPRALPPRSPHVAAAPRLPPSLPYQTRAKPPMSCVRRTSYPLTLPAPNPCLSLLWDLVVICYNPPPLSPLPWPSHVALPVSSPAGSPDPLSRPQPGRQWPPAATAAALCAVLSLQWGGSLWRRGTAAGGSETGPPGGGVRKQRTATPTNPAAARSVDR